MDWDYPMPSTVLRRPGSLGTNKMEEIELFGPPIGQVKRRFKRQNTVLQDNTRM